MNIRFVSTALDYSGFGSAARSEITALWIAGTNIMTEIIHQVPEQVDLGLLGDVVRRLQAKRINYKIKIIRLTPDLAPRHLEEGVYHILRVVHETDKLPPMWVAACNQMDEIWVPSESIKNMCKDSGVEKPILVFPEPLDVSFASDNISPLHTDFKKDFYFYNIAQWIKRKNHKALIRAYWKAFEGREDVTLILKTYWVTHKKDEYELIKSEIEDLRRELKLKHYPKIYLIKTLLTEDEVMRLHKLCDVYVSVSSAEGWNRPMAEAMLMGNPVIATKSGGITDLIDSYYYEEVPTIRTKVQSDNKSSWYTHDQNWNEVDEDKLEKKLKEAFQNFEKSKEKAKKAQKKIVEELSLQKVGKDMLERLSHVEG